MSDATVRPGQDESTSEVRLRNADAFQVSEPRVVGVSELVDVGRCDSVLAVDTRRCLSAMVAAVPGTAVVVFDDSLRVWFAEGAVAAVLGVTSTVGRWLPELTDAESWKILKGPCEAAVSGQTTRCELAGVCTVVSISVSPMVLPGGVPGALAVSHELGDRRSREAAAVADQDAARANEELLRSAFDRAPIGMTVIGHDGRWLRVNDACCDMLGYGREELVGTNFGDYTHPDDVPEDRRLLAAAVAGSREALEREKRYLRKDGSVLWVHVRSEMVRDAAGEPLYVVAHLLDISERRTAQEQRRASDRTLRSVIDNTPAMICVKDRDHRYQLVNRQFQEWSGTPSDETLGHRADELPWGGLLEAGYAKDQLVLDSGDAVSEEETILSGGRQRAFLTTRFPLRDENGAIHAVCIAATDITERREEERAKRERLQCSELIYSALAQDRFVLHGQPIVNLATMRVEQAELLVRMLAPDGDGDLVPPRQFLPAAERFDLIGLIDEWVLDRALELAAAGHIVEVNLSAKTISDLQQVDRIEREILASGVPARNLIFEITETAAADNLDAAREFARRLRALGCAFALDDFGVGHGTFTYLKHLPVDYLKLDLQFVRDLLSDESNQDVVHAIVAVAKQFDIRTIAEGVEDQATLETLRRMGVDFAQGYWIGRPVPIGQLWQPSTDQET